MLWISSLVCQCTLVRKVTCVASLFRQAILPARFEHNARRGEPAVAPGAQQRRRMGHCPVFLLALEVGQAGDLRRIVSAPPLELQVGLAMGF